MIQCARRRDQLKNSDYQAQDTPIGRTKFLLCREVTPTMWLRPFLVRHAEMMHPRGRDGMRVGTVDKAIKLRLRYR